ncbi:FAD/NAD(P)-binding domain-containing protein [Auricularia subglabra TFB-10046 SS5]|nr:FAD/NAD(P)-binding domain-containing protein [Auricularia subglabra TFB-10046 SS5]
MLSKVATAVYDVAIIGGGPAGLAAALALSRAHRRGVVFDSGKYGNERATHAHTIIGFDGKPPAEIRATAWRDINAYGYMEKVERQIERVENLSSTAEANGETLFDIDGQWKARKLIIATGARPILPDIPGFAGAWGYKIFTCAFCHGHEFSNQRGAIFGPGSLGPGKMFTNITKDLTVLLNAEPVPEPMQPLLRQLSAMTTAAKPAVISNRVSRIDLASPTAQKVKVHFADEGVQPQEFDFIAYAPRTQAIFDAIADLGLEAADNGDIKTLSIIGNTNVVGVFAAGDSAVMMKGVPMAMATGTGAGAFAAHALVDEDLQRAVAQEAKI